MILLTALMLAGGCGTERWDVKTLTDKAASQVTMEPVDATVSEMTRWKMPGKRMTKRQGQEFQVYRVTGLFKLVKIEGDKDLHIVIDDPDSLQNTMIIEVPSTVCEKNATEKALLPDLRRQFLALKKGTLIEVEGVAFFDFNHHQTGVARNAIELHPVTSLTRIK